MRDNEVSGMPVFQKDNVSILFVHIPKAGGTSIEHFFRRQDWKVSFFDGGEQKPSINTVTWCSPQHFHADILTRLFNTSRFSYCFTVVRNPVCRMKSEVRWRTKYFDSKIEPERWIEDALNRFERNPFVHDNHIRPQVEFTFSGLDVFPLEGGLDAVVAELTKRFPAQFSAPVAVPTVMLSGEDPIELSRKTLNRLEEFYQADYRQFKYVRAGDADRISL